jgi:hypothetical protein
VQVFKRVFKRASSPQWRKALALLLIVTLACSLAWPRRTEAASLAQIVETLEKIFTQYREFIGPYMEKILEFQQQFNDLYAVVLYPQAIMKATIAFVKTIRDYYTKLIIGIYQGIKVKSATLPETAKLEDLILTGYSGSFQGLEQAYKAVFGDTPTEQEASPEMRNMIDATTAASLSSLKTVALIITGGDQIQGISEVLESSAGQEKFAPGGAPYLKASALVVSIKSQILMQKLIAAQLRQEAGKLALRNGIRKRNVARAAQMFTTIDGMLKTVN